MKVMLTVVVAAFIADAILTGYVIGKNDLDVKAVKFAVRKGDELIAHIKAVPPATVSRETRAIA